MEKRHTDVAADLKEAARLLQGIAASTYIPFTSPAPSSTECAIRDRIRMAAALTEEALLLHRSMPYGRENKTSAQ